MKKTGSIDKKNENWLAKHTYRKLSNPLAMLLSKIGVTPVQASVISILMSVASFIFFSFGDWKNLVIGYIFLQLTVLMDHIDGAIARYTNNQTIVGSWYDKFGNKIHKFAFVFGVSLGVYRTTNDPFYLILGNAAGFMWIFSLYISETKRFFFKFKEDTTMFKEYQYKTFFPFTLLVTNIFGLLAVINRPVWALWFVIIASLNAFQQIYTATKKWTKENYSQLKL
ncbi:CDP-alcohol phosphatidyltransferase family protein [Candidatus Woesearchaeota archaeon]|nr:CDP-alcohol phosphatidyltransferase family protein [Candidatus Woesearchaeota archaeon]